MANFNPREKETVEKCVQQLHIMPTFVNCTFLVDALKQNRTYKGFIEDLSLNELSLELRDNYFTIQEAEVIYSTIEITTVFHLPDGIHEVLLTGIITWCKRIRNKDKSHLHLRIRLVELNEKTREVLKDYLYLGIGDKNLIWNLWDNLLMRA